MLVNNTNIEVEILLYRDCRVVGMIGVIGKDMVSCGNQFI